MGVRSGYKLTEVGVIPEEWEVATTREVCLKIQDGTHFSPRSGGSSEYLYITSKNIRFGYMDISSASRINKEQHRFIYKRCDVKKGDLLLTKDGANTGNVAINTLDEEFSLLSSVAFLRFDESKYNSGYFLQQFLATPCQRRMQDAMAGNAITRLTLGKINKLKFPIPPTVSEQLAIAEALSDVDALLNGLERLITKKRNIKQAAMQQLLTGKTRLPGFSGEWEMKRLGEIAEIVMGQSPSSTNYNTKGDGLPLIQGNADIVNRRTIKRIFTSQVTKRGQAGDVLMSVRAPVGEVSRATFEICLGRGVCAIRFPNDFLYHYLIYLEANWAKHSKGSTFDSVNSADVNAAVVSLPPIAEQTAIAAVLNDMDAELEALEKRRDKTSNLKQAMMQELLTGKTRLL